MTRPDLSDYKEVAERIRDFRDLHPFGSLQSEIVALPTPELSFVVVKAFAYRDQADERPGIGLAWEPFPGRTPYTKDSELQNAETSAWGRAIVAVLASDTKQGVASADEIRVRRNSEPTTARGSDNAGTGVKDPPPASVPAPQSPDEEGTASGESSGLTKGEGEAPAVSPATPEQRTRLLSVYKKPSLAKEAACRLFGYERPADVLITDLTSAEVEALILEAAS